MSPASRRIFFYWLLLLVPTLVVGGVAIQLLRREQARIATQGDYAQEARQAAVMARARLVVENTELLVGDVQAALLDTLGSEPASELELFLDQWEKNNPLVRTAFLSRPDGQLLRPSPNEQSEDSRGFVRRFSTVLRENPPWAPRVQVDEKESRKALMEAPTEPVARQEISSNVAQVQSARRDVQELAKARDYSAASARVAAEQSGDREREADFASSAPSLADKVSGVPSAAAPAASSRSARGPSSSEVARYANKQEVGSLARNAPLQAKDLPADRGGWTSISKDGRLHLIGWIQPGGDGLIRGVELELAALISRLGSALPAQTTVDEGYALRDDQSRVVHQIGIVSQAGEPVVSVPLSSGTLPGWSVVAYLSPASGRSVSGAGFFWTGVLLVALFVAAIVAGGSLLLRQARRSELEALQKTSFVGNVSHEFKTPLTTIRLYSELLEQGRVRDEKQGRDYLRTIGRETERLARLVNNALDFSQLEQGQKKFARERVDLAAALKRLLETHSPRVAEAGLTLKHELPEEPMHVITDRDAVEQIVLNLVDNACKYAVTGGEVLVSVSKMSSGEVELSVADRGPGVPTDQRDRIFEKFHRVNDALTAEKTGAGLGLSIARQLARGLGGDLRYVPRAGGGAEFILRLP